LDDAQRRLSEAEAEIERKTGENAELQEKLNEEITGRKGDNALNTEKQKLAEKDIRKLKAELQRQNNRIKELGDSLTLTTADRDRLKGRLHWLKAELAKLKVTLGCIEQFVSALKQEREELVKLHAWQSRVATQLGERCVSQGKRIPHLEGTLEDRKADCRRFQGDLRDLKRNFAVVTAERNEARTMVVTQIKQIREANEERFQQIRELHSQEICALIDAYETPD
jgi:chromosome segregation ATPase